MSQGYQDTRWHYTIEWGAVRAHREGEQAKNVNMEQNIKVSALLKLHCNAAVEHRMSIASTEIPRTPQTRGATNTQYVAQPELRNISSF
jgi:hypothetical protein